MKTIQLKGIICILGLLLSVSDLIGQQVITNHPSANGFPVIDLRELLPLGCILTSVEAANRRTEINNQTPSNADWLPVGNTVSSEKGIWNAKMSSLFQVMRTNHTVGLTNWVNAYNLCKQYKGEGGTAGQWRLPTQRELMMIWGLHPQLLEKGGFTPFNTGINDYYWSSSEYIPNGAWGKRFREGGVFSYDKVSDFYVRCVHDLM